MAQYGWTNSPAEIREQVETLRDAIADILADNLVGIYLHGSLAMRCFNPERSDIDLLVVTRRPMEVETKQAIVQHLLRRSGDPRPVEISFMHMAQLQPWHHPAPFDLHYGEEWREKYRRELEDGTWRGWNDGEQHDRDLAAHMVIARQRGVVLVGAPVAEVLPQVPRADYVDALLYDAEGALRSIDDNPVYSVLNLSRVLAYLQSGKITSKEEAGAWAEIVLPTTVCPAARQALNIYRGRAPEEPFDSRLLADYAAYMQGEIARLTSTGSAGE